jgi:hypothetical protein
MPISIDTIAAGALLEKVEIELSKLAANVKDPNTKPDAVRTITISIKVKPDVTRQLGVTEIDVKSSLAPSKGIPTSFIFDYDKEGKAVMKELLTQDPNQLIIDNKGELADATGNKVLSGNFR